MIFSFVLFPGGGKRATRLTVATAIGIWILAALLATPAYVGSFLRSFIVNPTTQVILILMWANVNMKTIDFPFSLNHEFGNARY